eukprot:TRINITY_DN15057_c0_g3_i1.p1 TRINITY_DN15057_c0_g3~~TRINITY_DN15057_c0_g3_i1.p1  ORF type:complete len:808 (+),score=292.34 TRINITY_DN15057_c0_g3_i1:32-2425(+)
MVVPAVSFEQAVGILKAHYGAHTQGDVVVSKLDSYIDQNFKVSIDGEARYVLKVANSDESEEQIAAEDEVLHVLSKAKGVQGRAPSVVPTDNGDRYFKNGAHFVRLITFLKGDVLAKVAHTPAVMKDLGALLGSMDNALSVLNIKATHRFLRWDLKAASSVTPLIDFVITNDDKKQLVKHFMDTYEARAPQMAALPLSLIHNDANDYNVLCHGSDTSLTDFGDMVTTYTICELAIALAYCLMDKDLPALLSAAVSMVHSYHSQRSLLKEELELLWWLIAARLCVSVTISAYEATRNPGNKEYIEISAGPAWKLLELMKEAGCEVFTKCVLAACGYCDGDAQTAEVLKAAEVTPVCASRTSYTKDELLAFRRAHCPKTLSIQYKDPLKIVRGRGYHLIDEQGVRYLDCVNNVCHVGHCHPRVVAAGQRQMNELNTNTRYLSDNIVRYIKELLTTMPEGLDHVFLVNSGTEANELAHRLATTFTKREHMLVVDHAYHGHSTSLIKVSPYKFRDQGKQEAPATTSCVDMPDVYRGTYTTDEHGADAAVLYANQVDAKLKELKEHGTEVAAFWAESLMGVGGQVIPPDGWLAKCHEHARKYGAVCIADEVQVGFGRVGTHWWAFQCQGGNVVPDIVTLGKPIGNGHPMAAVVCRKEIADAFSSTGLEYFATFGGNPVSCAIGLEVLNVIRDEGLMQNANDVGEYFKAELLRLQPKYDIVGDVRGKGMFIGAELVCDRESKKPWPKAPLLSELMKEKHVLVTTDGPDNNVLKIKPPIVWDRSCVDTFMKAFDEVLSVLCQDA